MRINPVFYVVLLELVPYNIPIIILDLSNKNKTIEYEVEDVINYFIQNG